MVALENDAASFWSGEIIRVHDNAKSGDNGVESGGELECAISGNTWRFPLETWNFFEFGAIYRSRHQGRTYEPWTLQQFPDQALLFEGIGNCLWIWLCCQAWHFASSLLNNEEERQKMVRPVLFLQVDNGIQGVSRLFGDERVHNSNVVELGWVRKKGRMREICTWLCQYSGCACTYSPSVRYMYLCGSRRPQ